jgi:hypothetical protein
MNKVNKANEVDKQRNIIHFDWNHFVTAQRNKQRNYVLYLGVGRK